MVVENVRNRRVHKVKAAVSQLQQELPYTCGATCLAMVLAAHKKIFGNEAALAKKLGTDSEWGPDRAEIERVAGSYGLTVTGREWMTIADLQRCVAKGSLVIILYQAWRAEPNPPAWERDWTDGHYSVVVGIDREKVQLADPWIGEVGWVSHKELRRRWHDRDRTGKRVIHYGLAFESVTGGAPLPEIANHANLPRV